MNLKVGMVNKHMALLLKKVILTSDTHTYTTHTNIYIDLACEHMIVNMTKKCHLK